MKGLSSKTAAQRLKEHGPNALTTKSGHHWYHILWSQFTDLLVIILILAAVVSFFLSHDPVDSFVIFGIVLLNAGIGFFQEFRTERTLEALKNMVHPEIRVYRDGEEQLLPTEDLVPGDWVILGEGDKVPSDGILIEAHSLKIEESALTGESLPLEKKADHEVFMGTSVARGSGVFEVKKTGMQTAFGEIAQLTTATGKTLSPLQIELQRIGLFVTKVTGVICLLLFFVGLWRDYSFVDSLLFSVSVAIAAVPEGLPTTVTIALALGAAVLARKQAIIKKLSSVETLGAVTTICSDKTGTLTKNEMTVRELYLADRSVFNVSGVGYDPHSGSINYVGGKAEASCHQTLKNKVLQACRWCNEAKLVENNHQFSILGDPTEGALLTLFYKDQLEEWGKKSKSPVTEIFPFDSDRKMMSVVIKAERGSMKGESKQQTRKSEAPLKVLVKGSPDQVLAQCTHWSDGTKKHKLDAAKRAKIQTHYERMAEGALRVLATATKTVGKVVPDTADQAEKGLTFLGLIGMIDPPREEVKDAVTQCRRAGIRIVVITGDYGITAQSIARELGIVRGDKVEVLTGKQTAQLSDAQLSRRLADRNNSLIFARSLPAQKRRIVSLLQAQNEIVAMTGDGVNDAPALKKANIGVAMGITGTEVSKEAATMILLNDSFASIVTAVGEGRRIYQNLRKFIWFIFSCNIAELFVIFAAILANFPLPLTAILILCIDLGTDILPAIALGVDNPEEELMDEKPRDTKTRVMNKKFVLNFLLTGISIGLVITMAFLYTLVSDGWSWGQGASGDWAHATTVAFTALVIVQLVNAFSARSFTTSIFRQNPLGNHFMLVAIGTSMLMTLLIIYAPPLNQILKTTPLNLHDWAVVVLASVVPLIVVETQKAWKRKALASFS